MGTSTGVALVDGVELDDDGSFPDCSHEISSAAASASLSVS